MTRMFKPADAAEQTAFVRGHCARCPRQLGCTLLADARPLDTSDPDYPDELVYDDLGRPSCTAFAAAAALEDEVADTFPPVTARPVPAAPVAEATAAARPTGRAAAQRPKPVTIRADRPVQSIVITTRTARDGTALSSTVRLQLAGDAR